MYAVIKTGGKQYKVAAGNLIAIERLAGSTGDSISFDEVLLVGGDNGTTVGSPLVAGAAVAGEIVDQKRTGKILVFKKRRRQNSKRSRGHRQQQTLVRITEILTDGERPAAKKARAAPEPKAEPKAEAAAAPAAKEVAPEKPKRATAKAAPAEEKKAAAKAPRTPRKKADDDKAKPARKPRAKAAKSGDKK
jgi:large subunit ribosomal protein L21